MYMMRYITNIVLHFFRNMEIFEKHFDDIDHVLKVSVAMETNNNNKLM